MFTRITNLDCILHMPTCCECKQDISPSVDSRLGSRIPILRIMSCTGGLICMTNSRCTLVWNTAFSHSKHIQSDLAINVV